MSARRAVQTVVGAAAVVVLAAGCVSIPTSSPVQPGRTVGLAEQPSSYGTLPEGPRQGAGRAEVVRGYLDAMLAYPQTDEIARRFLTPAAAQEWRTGGSVRVYGERSVGMANGATVRLRVGIDGIIDGRGTWTTPRARDAVVRSTLRLQKVGGEWRIANPPDGMLVDQDYFLRYYSPSSLYFLDPTRRRLVPDPVYVLNDDATVTSLVTALLRGPSRRLLGSVATAVPPGTSVELGVPQVNDGVVEIPLSENVLQLRGSDRLLLAAQFAWTLREVDQVTAVTITVDGAPLRIPGVGHTFSTDVLAGFDPAGLSTSRQLYGLIDGRLVLVSKNEVSAVRGATGRQALPRSRAAAVDASANRAALVPVGGRRIDVAGMRQTKPEGAPRGYETWFRGGTDLLPPSWDPNGYLWFVDQTPRGAVVRVAGGSDDVRQIDVPGVTGERVRGLVVSRDGARVAALVRRGDRTDLVISLIGREPRGGAPTDVRAAEVVRVAGSESRLRDPSRLAWSSPVSLVVLARGSNGTRQPYVVRIDGSTTELISALIPAEADEVAAGANDDTPVVVAATNQRLYAENADGVWRPVGVVGLRFPVYPG